MSGAYLDDLRSVSPAWRRAMRQKAERDAELKRQVAYAEMLALLPRRPDSRVNLDRYPESPANSLRNQMV